MAFQHVCCVPSTIDPDAFDGRSFCRSRTLNFARRQTASALVCQPCSSAENDSSAATATSDDVGDLNPDPQKYRFEASKGRWGVRQEDPFSKLPNEAVRNVVAQGMQRFEIGKVAPAQPAWERLSDNVLCVLAFNPSPFTLNGTNCYVVGTGKKRLLIDTGEDDIGHEKFLEALEDCFKANNVEGIQAILVTHMHGDHYGGIPGLLKKYGADIPVAKIPNPAAYFNTVEVIMERGLLPFLEDEHGEARFKPVIGSSKDLQIPEDKVVVWPDEEAEAGKVLSWDPVQRTKMELIRDYWFVKRSYMYQKQLEEVWNFQSLQHSDVIRTEGATLVAYHTPGHAFDHCSFWLQEEKSLFSGDHVLGWGTTFITDLFDYMKTLEFMVNLRPVHLYPGHGPMIEDGTGLLKRYIVHRKEREDQVEDVLLQESNPLSCKDIVQMIYTNTPSHRMWMALENVSKILRKFDKAGIARSFIRQEDGTLQRFDFPTHFMVMRRLPPGLVWLHRFHFRSGLPKSTARL